MNPHEYGAQANYEAIARRANGCGRYSSFPNVIELGSDTSLNIFDYQDWSISPTSLPEFTTQIGSQVGYLMAVPRLGLKDYAPCLNFNLQALLDSSSDLHNSRKVTTGFSITLIAILGVALLPMAYIILNKKNSRKDSQK